MDDLIDTLKAYMAHWACASGCDHWHCLKMTLDDLWCDGLLPRQAK